MEFDATVEEGEKVYNIRHRCFHFSREVILFVKEVHIDRVLFSVYDQLVRSATSIGANMVEGTAGSSRREWINFLLIALKSANETKYWLCLIRDAIGTDVERVNRMIQEADELSKIIAAIVIQAKST